MFVYVNFETCSVITTTYTWSEVNHKMFMVSLTRILLWSDNNHRQHNLRLYLCGHFRQIPKLCKLKYMGNDLNLGTYNYVQRDNILVVKKYKISESTY